MGIIIGGRLGYVFFYNPNYYLHNIGDAFAVWDGGMSFHGGFIGVCISTWIFTKKNKIPLFQFADIVACASPIGLMLGRIANFINGELVGKATNASWGVIFPTIDMLPRHPSQLYEALLEGVILFFILNIFILKKNYITGTCSYLFLIGYGFLRIVSEFFREPDTQIGYLFDLFSMGTALSFLMILSGIILFAFVKKNEN